MKRAQENTPKFRSLAATKMTSIKLILIGSLVRKINIG